MISIFSIAHVHIYSQCLTAALMTFQLLKMVHVPTIPQHLALWLLLNVLITLHCLENLKEPVSLLAGPTQTQLVVRNGWSVVQFVSEACHCWEVKGDWHHCASHLKLAKHVLHMYSTLIYLGEGFAPSPGSLMENIALLHVAYVLMYLYVYVVYAIHICSSILNVYLSTTLKGGRGIEIRPKPFPPFLEIQIFYSTFFYLSVGNFSTYYYYSACIQMIRRMPL